VILPMIKAELLKLYKRRSVSIALVTLTVGIVVIVMVVPEIYHLTRPHSTGPSGGLRGMWHGSIALAVIGSVAGMIVGSAAGTGDLSSGIFRDLVATGRSRWTLFAVRVPSVLLYFVPVVTVAFALMVGFDKWFGGANLCPPAAQCVEFANPTAAAFGHWYLWVLLVTCFDLLLSLGVASLLGSRSLTIGLLLGFQLIAAPLLAEVSALGGVRQVLFPQSFGALAPPRGPGGGAIGMFGQTVTTSVAVAWVVLVVWVVAMAAAGAYRTATRDA
jgi:hypothetical protein